MEQTVKPQAQTHLLDFDKYYTDCVLVYEKLKKILITIMDDFNKTTTQCMCLPHREKQFILIGQDIALKTRGYGQASD